MRLFYDLSLSRIGLTILDDIELAVTNDLGHLLISLYILHGSTTGESNLQAIRCKRPCERIIAILIGFADIKDKSEAKKEEAEAAKNN